LAIAAVYPHPNLAAASFGTNNYNGTDVLKDRADESIYKLTISFLLVEDERIVSPLRQQGTRGNPLHTIAGTGGVDYLVVPQSRRSQLNNTFLPSPTMVVTVGYGFNRFPNNSLDSSAGFDQTTLGFPSSYVSQLQKKSFPCQYDKLCIAGRFELRPFCLLFSKYRAWRFKVSWQTYLKSGFVFRSISVDFTDLSNGNGSFSFANDFVSPNDPLGKKAKTDLVQPADRICFHGSSVTQTIHLATNVPTTPVISRMTTAHQQTDLEPGLRYEWEAGLSARSNHTL